MIQTQSPCVFFVVVVVHACSTHNQHHHRRRQNLMSTTSFVCACTSLFARTMSLPACALLVRRPNTCLLVPCLCHMCSVCTRLPCHYFRRPTYQPPARVLLCSLYLLCTSCPLFAVVVIQASTICAEILSLYPMPFLSLSTVQPPVCPTTRLTHAWRGPPLRACHVYIRVQMYVCVSVM